MALFLRFSRSLASRVTRSASAAADDVDPEYPLVLTTARVSLQGGSSERRRASVFDQMAPEDAVEMHPWTARHYGLSAGDAVRLTTRCGTATFTLRLTSATREDTVRVPFYFGGGQVLGRLTNRVLNPVTKMPEFKGCAVRVGRVT